ncbi:MAG: hypothetical protein AB7U85_04855 [Alphaproteobacteria bacterium]
MTTAEGILLGIAIAEGVTKGIKTAFEAKELVEKLVEENRDPTEEEWEKLNAVTDVAHNAIQNA